MTTELLFGQSVTNISYDKNNRDAMPQTYRGQPVTPSDSVALVNGPTNAIWSGAGGTIAGTLADGTTTFVLTNAPASTILPVSAKLIAATTTTATGMYALYIKG